MGPVVDSYCRGCIYYHGHTNYVKYCGYLFTTGKRRPCNPGKGCTAKETKRKRKRAKKDES